jgi:transglutaminase-like putative cysteine protease
MTPQTRLRQWSAGASAVAQVAATASGMVPWWGLPLTLGLTVLVARPAEDPVDPQRSRLTRGAGVAAVGVFAGLIVFKTIAAGTAGADPIATLRSLTEALVILSLVMAPSARTPREYRVWLTVTTGVLVAAAAGGHSATSAAVALTSWIVLLAAITQVQAAASLAGGAVPAQLSGAHVQPSSAQQSRLLAAIIPIGAALIVGALVFFTLPAGVGGSGLANKIAGHVTGGTQSDGASRDSVGVDTYGDGQLSLLLRGALPDTPLVLVPANSPPLWRGTFYGTYNGQSWIANDNRQFTYVYGGASTLPPSPADPIPVGTKRTDPVTFAPGFHGSLIWSPGVPLQVTGIGGVLTGLARAPDNARLFGAEQVSAYRVTSAVADTSPRSLRNSVGADPSDPQWTQLPAELPAAVGQLARQITAHATNRYEQVRDIESYLRGHETYTQGSPVPGPGEDAVYDFLFRDHEGFCEQFASAEAVLLRTLDVPTRVVSGLAYGTAQGQTRLFTAANAHAWDEVYYPGIGWSPSDPTAGAQLAPAAASHRSLLDRIIGTLATNLPGGRTAVGVLIFALLVGAAIAGRAALQARTGRGMRRADSGRVGPVLAEFNRLAGHPRAPAPRAPPETAREYLGRVVAPGSLDQAVATLEQECYGEHPPDEQATVDAIAALAAVIDAPSP